MPLQNFCASDCPDGCSDVLPTLSLTCKVTTTDVIDKVFFSHDPFEDVTDEAEWASRLSNSSNSATAVRFRVVQATRPTPSPNTVKDEFGNTFIKDQNIEVVWEDSDNSDANYVWHNKMACTPTLRFWYKSGGKVYGGNAGIEGKFISPFGISDNNDKPSTGRSCKFSYTIQGPCSEERVSAPVGV